MVTVTVDTDRRSGVTYVKGTIDNRIDNSVVDAHSVRLRTDVEPIWAPRDGQPRWVDGVTTVDVPVGTVAGIGFATDAEPSACSIDVDDVRPAEDAQTPDPSPRTILQVLGDPRPPREAVPVPEGLESVGDSEKPGSTGPSEVPRNGSGEVPRNGSGEVPKSDGYNQSRRSPADGQQPSDLAEQAGQTRSEGTEPRRPVEPGSGPTGPDRTRDAVDRSGSGAPVGQSVSERKHTAGRSHPKHSRRTPWREEGAPSRNGPAPAPVERWLARVADRIGDGSTAAIAGIGDGSAATIAADRAHLRRVDRRVDELLSRIEESRTVDRPPSSTATAADRGDDR